MVSARLVDCPESSEEEDIGPIPEMMFAAGEEPVGVRVLTYQSSSALKRIINALEEEEVDIIRRSSFGKLIEIAEKPVFSGRFARYVLSRQLKTKKKHEAWFRFAGKPIRFSLREFAIVTGLPCGKFPRRSRMKLKRTISEKPYWPSLFGKVEVVEVSDVIKMLYRRTVKDPDIRIKYACLALLESVLLPTSVKMKISREHAEAIEDIQEFFSYPWGRVAFDMLMGSIKERDEVALSQNTIAVKGFVLALQLVMVEAVPALTEAVEEICSSSESESDEFYQHGRDIFTKKKSLNPAHARNVDRRCEVQVTSLIEADCRQTLDESDFVRSDEEADSRVDNLVTRIRSSYEFTTSKFRGGVRQIDVARMREARKMTTKARSGKYVRSNGPNFEHGIVVDAVMEKLKPAFKNVDQKVSQATAAVDGIEGRVVLQVHDMFAKFKDEMLLCVKDLVRSLISERDSGPCETFRNPTVGPTEVPGSATDIAGIAERNENIIKNVLSHLSEYSTPPRSNRMSQDENRSVGVTPEAATCAASANSQNRTRQNAFQQSLADGEKVTDEPTFSLGLTQEEHDKREGNSFAALTPHPDFLSCHNVDDNIAEGEGSRKSKRHKTVPTSLLVDYQCGRALMARVRDSQKYIFQIEDESQTTRKYGELSVRLMGKFVIEVSGVSVTAKDLQLVIERPRLLPSKVIDILIRVARYATRSTLPQEGPRSAEFLDSKFVVAMNRSYTRFFKSRNKMAYMFPKGLRDLFPSKDHPKVHPMRYYFPLNVGNKHWVGICFDARCGVLTVLDSNTALFKDRTIEKFLSVFVHMLPFLSRYVGASIGAEDVIECYDVARPKSVAQNTNPSDSGLMAVLLMATHALYGIEACKHITPAMVEEEGKRAAILAYELREQL